MKKQKPHGHSNGVAIVVGKQAPAPRSVSTSRMNHWKQQLAKAAEGIPQREWRPLVVKPHPRQVDIDAFKSVPSLVR